MIANHGVKAETLGCLPHDIYDFSASMNHAPVIDPSKVAESFETIHYYPGDYQECAGFLKYTVSSNFIFPTSGAMQALQLACSLFIEYERLAYSESLKCPFMHRYTCLHKLDLLFKEEVRMEMLFCFVSLRIRQGKLQSRCYYLFDHYKMRDVHWIMDESFIEMTHLDYRGMIKYLSECPNVLSCRSLTKNWNIPGLRLGFLATANQQLRHEIQKVQTPWGISSPTIFWAIEHLSSEMQMDNQKRIQKLLHEAQDLVEQPISLENIQVILHSFYVSYLIRKMLLF